MNVIANFLSSASGGALSYLRNLLPPLSTEFERSGGLHTLKVIVTEQQSRQIPNVPAGNLIIIPGGHLPAHRRLVWDRTEFPKLVRQEKADVIFIPYQIGTGSQDARLVLMLRNMDPFRFSDYDYGWRARLRGTVLRYLSSRALKAADRVVAVSRYTQDHMVDRLNISSDRIRQIYHGRDRGFTPVAGAGDVEHLEALGVKQGYILTCGSILPYRRTEDVIAAYALLAESVRGERQLVIAGDGTDRPYRRLIESRIQNSPLRNQIRWVGHVPVEAMRVLYRNSALCVLATEVEACPNIAIEALSSGCTILASNRQPLPEILGDAAHYYPARNVTGLAFEMELMLKSPELASALGSRAAAQSQAFDWVTCAKQTYAALVDWPREESPAVRQHASER